MEGALNKHKAEVAARAAELAALTARADALADENLTLAQVRLHGCMEPWLCSAPRRAGLGCAWCTFPLQRSFHFAAAIGRWMPHCVPMRGCMRRRAHTTKQHIRAHPHALAGYT